MDHWTLPVTEHSLPFALLSTKKASFVCLCVCSEIRERIGIKCGTDLIIKFSKVPYSARISPTLSVRLDYIRNAGVTDSIPDWYM
jgi:hypothetical protein